MLGRVIPRYTISKWKDSRVAHVCQACNLYNIEHYHQKQLKWTISWIAAAGWWMPVMVAMWIQGVRVLPLT